ncbi:hypothetical protein BJX63DRAFT_118686 [Aspergillus granulosus]|uniref:Stc1 domain-containing protein n=1 Tax=Aspergillus granulosus TaxID=176169 RepID=A0ABR4GUX9_9EURO
MNRRMSSGVPNAYRGGFNESTQRALERVNLPERIKCKTCHKWRLVASFSKRQLSLVRHAVVSQGPGALKVGHGSCLTCTNGQITELTCLICDKTKALDGFANNQRKEHENARCLSCVQGHVDAEPIVDENKLLTEGDFSTTHEALISSHTTSFSGFTHPSASSEASVPNAYTADDENLSLGGNNYVELERQDVASSHNHPQLGPSDAESVHSDWHSWGVTACRGPSTAAADDKPRKFAKIPAYKPESIQEYNIPARAPEVAKNKVHDEGYDDDEEDWVL